MQKQEKKAKQVSMAQQNKAPSLLKRGLGAFFVALLGLEPRSKV